ncbi:aldehyde ferredoxin oxidoreductase N-terminal domain-containing protein [Chloroflexota bacterium]
MRYGETGVNLEIDLSRGNIEKEESDPRLTELYLGGQGTNDKILWDRVPPEVEPFSPDNLLIFSTGILTGTPVPGANRTIINTVSPPTYLNAHSMMGGFWGPELKHAGYDKIIIRGKSPSWVYLWINNDKVEIRDASHLQGKGCLETAEFIKQELKQDEAQVAAIGLAGENRVYCATIEHGRSSASRGVGVIMGDKRLKAIAVRGTKDINIARPAELFEFSNDVMKKWRENPFFRGGIMATHDEGWHTNNFAWGNARYRKKDYWSKEIEERWKGFTEGKLNRLVSCYNCPNKCGAAISHEGVERFFLKCYSKLTYLMAAELEMDFAYRIIGITQEHGVDGYSMPQILAFALELYEAGILTDQDMAGMPSDTEGRFLWLTERIVRREGIGDVLADGTYWAAHRIGKGAEAYAHNNVKKLEQMPIKLGMLNYPYFLMYCTNEKMTITQVEGSYPQIPRATREEREDFVKDWESVPDDRFKQYYLDWEPRTHPTIEAACDIADWNEMMHYVDDSTGICAFWSSFTGQLESVAEENPLPRWTPYHIHNIPVAISCATGMDMDEARLWEIAKRNRTLVRGINVRLGLRREDEKPPEDHWKHRDPEMETKLLDAYYKFKGWNNDGVPTKETLDELDLGYVGEDLERRGVYKKRKSKQKNK